jgi:antitoxin VapB
MIMGAERHVRIFRNGRNRAVRIPKELDIFGDEVVMREEGERLILERPRREALADILARLEPITDEEWPDIYDPPPEPVDF